MFCNPPYRRPLVNHFIEKLAAHGNGIALVFNRMDTALWHDIIFPTAHAMLILKGRVDFKGENGLFGRGAGCGSVLVAWGWTNVAALALCNLQGKLIILKQY